MQVVLLVVQFLLAIALIGVILIQRSAQDGGGLTGGSTTMGGLFTARGSANLLTHTTAVLAFLFIVNSLVLGYMASKAHNTGSAFDQVDQHQPEPVMPPALGAPNPVSNSGPDAGKTAVPPPPSVPLDAAPMAQPTLVPGTPAAPTVPMGQ